MDSNTLIKLFTDYIQTLDCAYKIVLSNDAKYENTLSVVRKYISYYRFEIDNKYLFVIFDDKDVRYDKLYDIYNDAMKI